MAHPTQNRYGAAFGLAVGLCMALAANITAAWPQGRVMIVAGVAAPIVLPLVLWIRAGLTPKATRYTPQWWCFVAVREMSVTAVAAPAAALSYWHTYTLMAAYGIPHVIAAVLPFSADGVATISTLALHHHRPAPEVEPAIAPEVEPVVEVQPEPVPAVVSRRRRTKPKRSTPSERAAWLHNQLQANPDMSWSDKIAALAAEFDISHRTAARAISETS